MLYDKFIKQFLIEMGELLEEAKVEFLKWHFKQKGKYTNPWMLHMNIFGNWKRKRKRKKIQGKLLMKK